MASNSETHFNGVFRINKENTLLGEPVARKQRKPNEFLREDFSNFDLTEVETCGATLNTKLVSSRHQHSRTPYMTLHYDKIRTC